MPSFFPYLNSESGAAQLHETVDLVKTQPVVVVASRWTKPVTVFRPGMVESHRTFNDLPHHQDPSIDCEQRHGDSRVSTQSSSGRLLVRCSKIWQFDFDSYTMHTPLCKPLFILFFKFQFYGLSEQSYWFFLLLKSKNTHKVQILDF